MRIRLTTLLVVVGIAAFLLAGAAEAKNTLIVTLSGTGTAEERDVDIDGDGVADVLGALCFDVDLIDTRKDKVIGTATDCLSDVVATGADCLVDGTFNDCTVELTDTSIFNFGNGTVISQESVSIQPFVDADSLSTGATHLTGSAPPGPNVTYTSPAYNKYANGAVRLSGIVDMSALASDGQITFDCLFTISKP